MADGLRIKFEDSDVEKMLNNMLTKVKDSKPIIDTCSRYVNAVTKQMFIGKRPDNIAVRGVKWEPLSPKTIEQKKKVNARNAKRPLVRTGDMRDSLKVITKGKQGFTYGTNKKSPKGFNYPGFHQVGNAKVPARLWLFLTREDLGNMIQIALDHIRGLLKNYNNYTGK
jgi:phage gpG-like protein